MKVLVLHVPVTDEQLKLIRQKCATTGKSITMHVKELLLQPTATERLREQFRKRLKT